MANCVQRAAACWSGDFVNCLFVAKIQFLAESEHEFKEKVAILANRCYATYYLFKIKLIFINLQVFEIFFLHNLTRFNILANFHESRFLITFFAQTFTNQIFSFYFSQTFHESNFSQTYTNQNLLFHFSLKLSQIKFSHFIFLKLFTNQIFRKLIRIKICYSIFRSNF